MKKKKIVRNIILVIVGIVVILTGIILYFVVKDLKQEALLKQEIVNYSNRNLETDEFPITVKTTGDYAYVEEAVKKYYKNLSDNVKAINSYLKNEELQKVLTPSSLKANQPEYTSNYAIIKSTKDKVNEAIGNIDQLCDEKTIKSLLDKDKLSDWDYYYDFYLQLMYTKKDKKDLEETRKGMQEISTIFNSYLDKALEILDFLKANDSVIEYGSGVVYFTSDSALTEYNRLVSDLQEIANKINKVGSNTKSNKENHNDAV